MRRGRCAWAVLLCGLSCGGGSQVTVFLLQQLSPTARYLQPALTLNQVPSCPLAAESLDAPANSPDLVLQLGFTDRMGASRSLVGTTLLLGVRSLDDQGCMLDVAGA